MAYEATTFVYQRVRRSIPVEYQRKCNMQIRNGLRNLFVAVLISAMMT